MNVETAFLYDGPSEDILMNQLQEFEDATKLNHFCKHKIALLGLKEISRQWYLKINSIFEQGQASNTALMNLDFMYIKVPALF